MFKKSVLIVLVGLLSPGILFAGCTTAAWSELILPGSGYLYAGQWGKAFVFGGSRWIWTQKFIHAKNSADLIPLKDRFKVTPKNQSKSQKTELVRRINQTTLDYYTAINWQLDTGFLSFWDLEQHNCQANNDVYGAALAPLRLGHFGSRWGFWVGMAAVVGFLNSGVIQKDLVIQDKFYNGYTAKQFKQDIPFTFYPVGIGEEAMFRGSLQTNLYQSYIASGYSKESSRHLAVWSAAFIFGALHFGSAPTANPAGAVFLGAYSGYLYQPAVGEYDLITAMAFHTWFDIAVNLAWVKMSQKQQLNNWVQPIFKVGFQF